MMRIVDSTDRLFLKNYLRDFLTLKRQALFEEIASLDEDPLLTTSLEDLCDQLVNEYTLSAPKIDESGIYSETGDAKVVGSQWFDDGRNVHYDPQYRIGTTVTVYVPFTGIPELFECHPLTATDVMPPRAFVRDSELAFEYQTRHVEGDGLKKAFDRDLNSLRSNLAQIAHDLEVFNSSIQEAIRQRIPARHKKLLQDRQIAESLGFPTKRATDVVGTPARPQVKPDVAPQPPPVSQKHDRPWASSDVVELRSVLDSQLSQNSRALAEGQLPPDSLLRLVAANDRQESETPDSPPGVFAHSDDYISITFRGQSYTLTDSQAAAVRVLHENAKRGTPYVNQHTVLAEIESGAKRLRDLFRDSLLWDTLIVMGKRGGIYKLNI